MRTGTFIEWNGHAIVCLPRTDRFYLLYSYCEIHEFKVFEQINRDEIGKIEVARNSQEVKFLNIFTTSIAGLCKCIIL